MFQLQVSLYCERTTRRRLPAVLLAVILLAESKHPSRSPISKIETNPALSAHCQNIVQRKGFSNTNARRTTTPTVAAKSDHPHVAHSTNTRPLTNSQPRLQPSPSFRCESFPVLPTLLDPNGSASNDGVPTHSHFSSLDGRRRAMEKFDNDFSPLHLRL